MTLKHCITLGYVSAAMFFNMVDFLLTMTQIFPIFYSKKKVQNAKKCTQRMKKVNSKRRNKTVLVDTLALPMLLHGPLIHPCYQSKRKKFGSLSVVPKKLAKSGCSLLFNGTCLKENDSAYKNILRFHQKLI